MKPLVLFIVLAYALSWIIWLPLWWPAAHLPQLPYQHALGGLGPMLAALIVQSLTQGNKGRQAMTRAMFRIASWRWILLVTAGPWLLAFLTDVALYQAEGRPLDLSGYGTSAEYPEMNAVIFFIYNVIAFGYGEETGWRGFVLPRLQQKMGAFLAATVLTVIWALWHWPLFLYRPGYTAMPPAGIAGWVFSLFTGSILLTWLFNSTRGSILICALFHATIDIAFLHGTQDMMVTNIMGTIITFAGILVVVIYKPQHLSRSPRLTALPIL